MPHEPPSRTQEQSIKARKHQLFESDSVDSGPRQSFKECLRTTPADPLSPFLKALLWVLGTVVVLLLLAALLTSGKSPKPKAVSTLMPAVAARMG